MAFRVPHRLSTGENWKIAASLQITITSFFGSPIEVYRTQARIRRIYFVGLHRTTYFLCYSLPRFKLWTRRSKLWPLCTTLILRPTLQGRVLSHAYPTRLSWSVTLPVVHSDRVPCDTVRLQVELPNVLRALEKVHRHFLLSIYYADRQKLGRGEGGYMRRKAQFRRTRKSAIGPRPGNSVNHPRVEKSAFQEICSNRGFCYRRRKGVLGGCYREEFPLSSVSCECFLSINRTLFGLHGLGCDDTYLKDSMFESCEISLRRQDQNRQ